MWNSAGVSLSNLEAQAMLVFGYLRGGAAPIADLVATTVDDTSVTLTFTPVSGATLYEYRVDGGSWVACADTSGTQLVTGLTANTAYTFEVRSRTPGGYSAASNTASATTFTSQAVALFARMTTPPVSARKILINTVFASLISNSLLAKIEVLYLFAAADAQVARLNWISTSFNATAVSSPTFTPDRGYAGDGSSSYLNTNWNPAGSSIYLQNSASMGVYINGGTLTSTGGISCGATDATNGSFVRTNSSGFLAGRMNQGSTVNYGATATRAGLTSLSRTASNLTTAYRNGASNGTQATASATRTAIETYICGVNNNGTFGSGVDNRHGMFYVSSGFTGTDETDFYNIILAYLTAVGGN
jgi:hypothetical protein